MYDKPVPSWPKIESYFDYVHQIDLLKIQL